MTPFNTTTRGALLAPFQHTDVFDFEDCDDSGAREHFLEPDTSDVSQREARR